MEDSWQRSIHLLGRIGSQVRCHICIVLAAVSRTERIHPSYEMIWYGAAVLKIDNPDMLKLLKRDLFFGVQEVHVNLLERNVPSSTKAGMA